jgi:hypothetical protein
MKYDFLLRTSASTEDVLITYGRSHVLVMAQRVHERGSDIKSRRYTRRFELTHGRPCLETSCIFMYRYRCKETISVVIESKRKENSLICYLNLMYFRGFKSRQLRLAGYVMYLYTRVESTCVPTVVVYRKVW